MDPNSLPLSVSSCRISEGAPTKAKLCISRAPRVHGSQLSPVIGPVLLHRRRSADEGEACVGSGSQLRWRYCACAACPAEKGLSLDTNVLGIQENGKKAGHHGGSETELLLHGRIRDGRQRRMESGVG
jgi:hypothetical protein